VSCSTVSSPWPIRLRHSADPVSSTCDGSGRSVNDVGCEQPVHAFVRNRLDCCNSLLAGVSNQLLQRLQLVQNAAARLVKGARRSEHMSTILRDLHWLPVRQRIVFKAAVLAYKCQHGMAPEYLQVYFQPTSILACRRLRSAHSGRLAVPRTRTSYSDRSFAVQGPSSCNSLPAELRTSDVGLDMFRRKLKTFLFNW